MTASTVDRPTGASGDATGAASTSRTGAGFLGGASFLGGVVSRGAAGLFGGAASRGGSFGDAGSRGSAGLSGAGPHDGAGLSGRSSRGDAGLSDGASSRGGATSGRTTSGRASFLGGLATIVASAAGNQAGAALGARAFPAIGPAGVVAVRQFVAAAVLLPVARPNLRRLTWAQWWPTLLLALVFATMNLSLYTAIDRIGLGLAVTLEFLGPLAVALCGSRTRSDLACALVAAAGVWVLVLPGPSSDYVGVGLGLVAAGCWAGYILLNRLVGRRLPGLQAPAAATTVSAALYLPVAVVLLAHGRFTWAGVGYAVGAGVLSSVVPYAADLVALRRLPPRFFGLLQSIHPVLAALAGAVILGQVPAAHVWAGIAIVVATNAVAVALTAARRPEPAA